MPCTKVNTVSIIYSMAFLTRPFQNYFYIYPGRYDKELRFHNKSIFTLFIHFESEVKLFKYY